MSEVLPSTVYDVPTPCLVVDVVKVKRNAAKITENCRRLGVKLRAHVKTHKTVEAAEILTNGQKKCISVSTLQEAEFFADNGFDDILYAYPITKNKIARCRKIHTRLNSFHLMLDSKAGFDALQSSPLADGKMWTVYIEIDINYHRTGVSWKSDDVINLARLISESDVMTLRGIYCHDGDSYYAKGSEQIRAAGKESTKALMTVKQRLVEQGIECTIVCMGSTPSCSCPDDSMSALQEFSAGNYVFYGLMQKDIGSCSVDEIACRVATRVIGHKPEFNLLIVDCGFLAISKDGMECDLPNGPWVIQDQPNLRLVGMSQELGKITTAEGQVDFSSYPIGTMLFIYPYHSCVTAAMHPKYYVHSGDNIVDVWRPTRGW